MKRFVSILLLLALLLGCLPVSVLADGGEGYFYLAASTQNGLIIAPERVHYTSEQTVRQALAASGHVFAGLEGGIVSAIDGVSGNFVRGDENGDFDLDKQASSVNYYYFRESNEGALSSELQSLMKAMADYLYEEADVRTYAKSVYDDAKAKFPGITDADAQTCAAAIKDAINAYKDGQNKKYPVTFSGYTDAAYTIYAVSEYGKRINAENGALSLPNGAYTFYIYKENKAVSGSLTVNGSARTIDGLPEIPADAWINESKFQISKSSDLMFAQDFIDGELKLTRGTHTASAELPDTFQSQLYPYVTLSSDVSNVTLSAVYANSADGTLKAVDLTSGSKRVALYNVLSKSAKGNTVIFRASKEDTDSGCTLLEDFTLTLKRTLTLSGLTVQNANGEQQPAQEEFTETTMAYTYRVLNTEKVLNIYPTPTASGVTVTVGEETLNEAGYASVSINSDKQEILVKLSTDKYESTYTLTIERDTATTVKVTLGDGVTELVMLNRSGEELKPTKITTTTTQYTYSLIANETYTYRATRDKYFHTEKTFQLTTDMEKFTAEVPTNMPSLSNLRASTSKLVNQYDKDKLALSPAFASGTYEYTTTVADTDGNIAVWAVPVNAPKDATDTSTISNAVCTVYYNGISRTEKDGTALKYTPGTNVLADGTQLEKVLLTQNACGNTLTFNVAQSKTDTTGTTTYSTDYVLTVKRALTLRNLEISGVTLNFSGAEKDYTITVPAAQSTLSLTATAWDNSRYNDTDGGYVLLANDNPIESGKNAEIPLSGDSDEETVMVTVKSRDELSEDATYTIKVQKAAGSTVTFNVQPSGALLYIFDKDNGSRVWPDEDGSCAIFTGHTYGYSVTKPGYAGKSGYFQLENNQLVFGTIKSGAFEPDGTTHDIKKPYSISLTAAPESTLEQFKAEWPNFRGNPENNGVTKAKTPIEAEAGTLHWAVKAGSGYGSSAVSSPILVGSYLYAYAGSNILKIDKDTGAVLDSGEMVGSSNFSIVPPTYADGMILVGLSNGRIQAFNAETLESLWVYYDPLGGQPNCPITVHDGCAYTGFWNGEEKDAAFVCLSLTDEYTDSTTESKAPTWRYVQKGGFYWAGAYVCDEFVMVGTDDGDGSYTSATANLLLFEPKTGKLLDSETGFAGDIRSSICYDDATKAYYFTSKGGYFYSVKVTEKKLTDLRSIQLSGMSTSTPVVANGRAYVGVSGSSQFGAYSGHNITVIDLASWGIAYQVQTKGYPQTSGLLTTAYEGYNYVYFLDNYTPGTLRLLRDNTKTGSAELTTSENNQSAAYALFTPAGTPAGSQAQYCICSPIADENGTLYFKNDSGYLMAFGSAIVPDSLTVVSQPTKLVYKAGELFEKNGLQVTAQFTDGTTRDVTKLMAQEVPAALTEGTPEVTLKYAPGHIMYHNEQNDADKTMTAGVESTKPTVQIYIRVGDAGGTVYGDLNWGYASGQLTLSGAFPTGAKLIAAVYDATGRMTGTKLFTTTGSAEISGAKIKLFLLDSTGKPLCEAVTVAGA